MTKSDLIKFCEIFYSSHYIPIALLNQNGEVLFKCTPKTDIEGLYDNISIRIKKPTNPALYTSGFGRYGLIDIIGSEYSIVIGPVFNCVISKEVVNGFLHEHGIHFRNQQEAIELLGSLPQISYNQFINLIAFLHYQLNHELIDVVTHFKIDNQSRTPAIAKQQAETIYNAKEEQQIHGTYYFERQLIALIKSGNVAKLQDFLRQTIKVQKLNEGKLADTPLRQAKNLFIGVASIAGKTALIEGGVDIEQAYQMIDVYIQECEKSNSLESIKTLQYNMTNQ